MVDDRILKYIFLTIHWIWVYQIKFKYRHLGRIGTHKAIYFNTFDRFWLEPVRTETDQLN